MLKVRAKTQKRMTPTESRMFLFVDAENSFLSIATPNGLKLVKLFTILRMKLICYNII